jgi:hypothetical protein
MQSEKDEEEESTAKSMFGERGSWKALKLILKEDLKMQNKNLNSPKVCIEIELWTFRSIKF